MTEVLSPAVIGVASAPERLSSGIRRFDTVLGGGLPANTITLVSGVPGSGKTILAEQYAFANGTAERPAIYLSTVTEPLDKILRFGQGLTFFDAAAVGTRVIYEAMGPRLHDGGLPAVLEHVVALLKERRPSVMVIDSFKALREFAPGAEEYRRFLSDLGRWMSAFPVAAFWVGEYREDELMASPEAAVGDAIIHLGVARAGTRESRELKILKLRGGNFLSGAHAYRISPEGIEVFPRLADPADAWAGPTSDEPRPCGLQALDRMLGHGYRAGSSIMCAGPGGVGKTVLGMHLLVAGARSGEPGLIASLQEDRVRLDRLAGTFGWSLDDEGVTVMSRSPVDVYVDQWVYELIDEVERTGARRVMVDGLNELRAGAIEEVRFREFMYSLMERLGRLGVSLYLTLELPGLFGVDGIPEAGVGHMADNVLLLQYVREGAAVRRAMTVLKTRASGHAAETRLFEIGERGLLLGDPVDPRGAPG